MNRQTAAASILPGPSLPQQQQIELLLALLRDQLARTLPHLTSEYPTTSLYAHEDIGGVKYSTRLKLQVNEAWEADQNGLIFGLEFHVSDPAGE